MQKLVVQISAAAGVAFVLVLAGQLPEHVTSHFSASGRADGYMPRGLFVIMVVSAGLVPLLTWWHQERAIRNGWAKVPNAGTWLAPEHRQSTERWLQRHAAVFSVCTTLFLAYVYWLVVQANRANPASLPVERLWPVLLLYLGAAAVWAAAPFIRFRRHSDA